jgi:hypothetical protein
LTIGFQTAGRISPAPPFAFLEQAGPNRHFPLPCSPTATSIIEWLSDAYQRTGKVDCFAVGNGLEILGMLPVSTLQTNLTAGFNANVCAAVSAPVSKTNQINGTNVPLYHRGDNLLNPKVKIKATRQSIVTQTKTELLGHALSASANTATRNTSGIDASIALQFAALENSRASCKFS